MHIRNFATLVVVCLLSLLAFGAHAQRQPVPVVDYVNESWPRPDSKQLTQDQVRQAIRRAVENHRTERNFPWKVEPTSDGNLLASTTVRGKHTVRVSIANTASDFTVKYQSSIDMKAAKEGDQWVVHPFYNRWVGDLVRAIKDELARA